MVSNAFNRNRNFGKSEIEKKIKSSNTLKKSASKAEEQFNDIIRTLSTKIQEKMGWNESLVYKKI